MKKKSLTNLKQGKGGKGEVMKKSTALLRILLRIPLSPKVNRFGWLWGRGMGWPVKKLPKFASLN